jgi:hypothetical protein
MSRDASCLAGRGRGELSVAFLLADVDKQRLILVVEDDDATRSFLLDNSPRTASGSLAPAERPRACGRSR